jgi:hypothetical protein
VVRSNSLSQSFSRARPFQICGRQLIHTVLKDVSRGRTLEVLLDIYPVCCAYTTSYRLTTEGCKIRRINVDPSTRDIVRKAYEFALNHVGQDKDSGEIWSDYIQFLRSGEVCYDCLLSFSSEIRNWSSVSCSSYLTLNSSCFTTPTIP